MNFKSIAFGLAAAASVLVSAPAEAFTTACKMNPDGSIRNVAIERDRYTSPRYFAGADTMMMHDDGTVSYRLSRNNWASVYGRWEYTGNTVIITNPDNTSIELTFQADICHKRY